MLLVIPVLGVAGLIEAFLSPSGAGDAVKAVVGILTGAALWGYVLFAGRPRSMRGAKAAANT
jgi:uncharacterized membrane protein SpoIIM required for sporulation